MKNARFQVKYADTYSCIRQPFIPYKNQRVVVGQHETMYQGGSQGGQTFPRTGIARAMIFFTRRNIKAC